MNTDNTTGYQRLTAAVVTLVLAVMALFGLPPEKGQHIADLVTALGTVLIAVWTIRKPGAASIK